MRHTVNIQRLQLLLNVVLSSDRSDLLLLSIVWADDDTQ